VDVMDYYLLIATVSLIIQIAIISLLIVAYQLKRKSNFRAHGLVMLTAVAVHLAAIFVVMLPAFVVGFVPFILANPTSSTGVLAVVHAAFGAIAAVLGVWIMANWRLRKSLAYCTPMKRIMLTTFIAWSVALSLGIIVYVVIYLLPV
jgi:hypothetical protein